MTAACANFVGRWGRLGRSKVPKRERESLLLVESVCSPYQAVETLSECATLLLPVPISTHIMAWVGCCYITVIRTNIWILDRYLLNCCCPVCTCQNVDEEWTAATLMCKYTCDAMCFKFWNCYITTTTYLIIVADAADAVSVNFFGRCKFVQI